VNRRQFILGALSSLALGFPAAAAAQPGGGWGKGGRPKTTTTATTTTTVPSTTTTETTVAVPTMPTLTNPPSAGWLNVMDYGAVGNGTTDDTAAINSAIAACVSGGTVIVPAGTYRVICPSDSLFTGAIVLKSNMTLSLAADVTIRLTTANSFDNYAIISGYNVDNVTVIGESRATSVVQGDAYLNGLPPTAATHSVGEHGHCIRFMGSRDITIESLTTREAAGDGIYIGPLMPGVESERVTVTDVLSEYNRRGGLSSGGLKVGLIQDSTFAHQTAVSPRHGLDLEPIANRVVDDVVVEDCEAHGNTDYGFVFSGQTSGNLGVHRCIMRRLHVNYPPDPGWEYNMATANVEDARVEYCYTNDTLITGNGVGGMSDHGTDTVYVY